MISNEGIERSRTSTSTMRWSSLPSRSCTRSFSRVRCTCSRRCDSEAGLASAGTGEAGSSRSSRRSSADCSARSATSSSFSSRTMSIEVSTKSRTMDSTSRPTYPTSVYFEASTLTKGQPARRARRRAISVLPTPVGPIIRIFFGRMSSASSGGSFWRRTRLRRATAIARLAAACPTMYLSSSATISRGVMSSSAGRKPSPSGGVSAPFCTRTSSLSDLLAIGEFSVVRFQLSVECQLAQLLDGEVGVGVDANFAGDAHGFHGQVFGPQLGVFHQGTGRRKGVGAARTDGHDTVVGFDDVAIAGENKGAFGVCDDQQSLEMTKRAVLAPFLGELDGGFGEVAGKFLQLAFEAFEEGDGVGGGTGETGDDFVLVEPARFPGGVLHHVIAHGDLAIGEQNDFAFFAHAQNGGAVHGNIAL